MSRDSDYTFVKTDTADIEAALVAAYEEITGVTVRPASPEKLFISWVASIIVLERVYINYVGNQNIPSRAAGSNLDALGQLFFGVQRPQATKAVCTVRFYISEAQAAAVLIPRGTRVTDTNAVLYWETTADAYVAIGDTYADVTVQCLTAGTVGNGYAADGKYRYDHVLMEQQDFYEALGDDAVSMANKYHLLLWDRDAGSGQSVPMVMGTPFSKAPRTNSA